MVIIAGTALDTRNAADQDAIVDLLDRDTTLTSARLSRIKTDLEALGTTRTDFENRLLGEAKRGEARMTDVELVRQQASTQGGVWSAGRVVYDDQFDTIYQTQAIRAGGSGNGAYAQSGYNVSSQELAASTRDSEVAVLDELSEYLTAQLSTITRPLHIILSGSMGPCLGCQGRIIQFIRDLNAIARNVGNRVLLVLEVNYTTRMQPAGTPGLPRNTQYGYTHDAAVNIPNSPVRRYWCKTFTTTLGVAVVPVITESPG